MTHKYKLAATATFGLEALVKKELRDLGIYTETTSDGRIFFQGDTTDIINSNLWLRTAERVVIILAEAEIKSFDELFDFTYDVDWADILTKDAVIHVKGRSIKSTLFSVPDCQKIVKKAIITKLQKSLNKEIIPETGDYFSIEIEIRKDKAMLLLDTTGSSLHKRGYRQDTGGAPLKETLAASLVLLSKWESPQTLIDPCCGSGTIPIEAALIATNTAPGLDRSFSSEPWLGNSKIWDEQRELAESKIIVPEDLRILASDIHWKSIKNSRANAKTAQVEKFIHFQEQELSEISSRKSNGVLITNPPYGKRIGEFDEINELYQDLKDLKSKLNNWSYFIISADEMFEKKFYPANKRRKLYNGNLKCQLYQYFSSEKN